MGRVVEQTGATYGPPALLTDTSSPRDFFGPTDPSTIGGITLARGDQWFSTTPPSGGGGGGGGWTYGVTRPDQPGMAGVPSGTSLFATTPGDIVLTDTGFQYKSSGLAVPSTVQSGNGLTVSTAYKLSNCFIDGRVSSVSSKFGWLYQSEVAPSVRATSDTGCVDTNSTAVPHVADQFTIEQCDLHCRITDFYTDGIIGHGWTSKRNHIWHTVDGLGSYTKSGANAWVKTIGDWIELQTWVGGSTYAAGGNTQHAEDGSHSDAWQIQGGLHHEAYGTFFSSGFDNTSVAGVTPWIRKTISDNTATGNGHQYYGSLNGSNCVQITQTTGQAGYIIFRKCWFDGAYSQSINFSGTTGYTDGADYLNCVIDSCQWGARSNRVGHTAGYFISGTDRKSSTPTPGGTTSTNVNDVTQSNFYVINTPTGSTLADNIDFGNGTGQPGTNTYWAVGDALDGTHVPVRKNSGTVYRLA